MSEWEQEYLVGLRKHARDARTLLSNANRPERERIIVRAFLRCLGVSFSDDKIQPSTEEPVGVHFRSAGFQIMEIVGEKKRGDEFDIRRMKGQKRKGKEPAIAEQTAWMELCEELIPTRRGNTQFQVGVHFPYKQCKKINTSEFASLIKKSLVGIMPLVLKLA